jgi:flagellar biosynthesis/type III secretory pathway protein FliH
MPMNYGSWNDEELRRALNADPDDVDAIIEAAERFRAEEVFTVEELETAEQDAREEGYRDGYEEGYEEGYWNRYEEACAENEVLP